MLCFMYIVHKYKYKYDQPGPMSSLKYTRKRTKIFGENLNQCAKKIKEQENDTHWKKNKCKENQQFSNNMQ